MQHRREDEVWGDDPEERDATEVIAELEAAEPDFERRWHEHPAFLPFKAVGRFIARNGKRIAVTIVGFVVILAGILMLVLPGPGWAAIFLGLAILATEYVWARRLLDKAKAKFGQAKDAVLRKNRNGPTDASGSEDPSTGPSDPSAE
jgi:uncharacterized protein (TIGR02611 family)